MFRNPLVIAEVGSVGICPDGVPTAVRPRWMAGRARGLASRQAVRHFLLAGPHCSSFGRQEPHITAGATTTSLQALVATTLPTGSRAPAPAVQQSPPMSLMACTSVAWQAAAGPCSTSGRGPCSAARGARASSWRVAAEVREPAAGGGVAWGSGLKPPAAAAATADVFVCRSCWPAHPPAPGHPTPCCLAHRRAAGQAAARVAAAAMERLGAWAGPAAGAAARLERRASSKCRTCRRRHAAWAFTRCHR